MPIPIYRGDVVTATLRGAEGCEKKGKQDEELRLCVVVQNDDWNQHSPLTIVVPLTHRTAKYQTEVPVAPKELKLPYKPVLPGINYEPPQLIDCSQPRTIDREIRIKQVIGRVAPGVLPRVDAALAFILGLTE